MYLWSPYNQHARADPRMLHQKLFFSWKFRAQAATCLPYKHWYPHHEKNHEPIPPTQWEYGWIYMLLLLLPELKSPEQPQDTWLLKNQGQGNTAQPSAKARWTGWEHDYHRTVSAAQTLKFCSGSELWHWSRGGSWGMKAACDQVKCWCRYILTEPYVLP